MNKRSLKILLERIEAANGPDHALDREIRQALLNVSGDAPDYTASIDRCLELMHETLPDWHWHVGRGANGIMPYASMSKDQQTYTADGITVPLVLLAVMIKVLLKKT